MTSAFRAHALPTPKTWQQSSVQRGLTTNSTTTSLAARIPTTTEPETTAGSLVLTPEQLSGCEWLGFWFFGSNANNEDFHAQFTAFRTSEKTATLYIPEHVIRVVATESSTLPGIANTGFVVADLFADTIALVTASSLAHTSEYEIINPQNDVMATLYLRNKGWSHLAVDFDINAGASAAASANVAWWRA